MKTMDRRTLDAFVYPTWSNPPRLIGDMNTPHGDNSQFFSPTTGFPRSPCPMGYTRNNAARRHDALRSRVGRTWLIGLAYSYEQATKHRRPPKDVVSGFSRTNVVSGFSRTPWSAGLIRSGGRISYAA